MFMFLTGGGSMAFAFWWTLSDRTATLQRQGGFWFILNIFETSFRAMVQLFTESCICFTNSSSLPLFPLPMGLISLCYTPKQLYIYACICTYMYTYFVYIHMHIFIYIHTYMHTHAHWTPAESLFSCPPRQQVCFSEVCKTKALSSVEDTTQFQFSTPFRDPYFLLYLHKVTSTFTNNFFLFFKPQPDHIWKKRMSLFLLI